MIAPIMQSSDLGQDPALRLFDDSAPEWIAGVCRSRRMRCIWVEGFSHSGKTTLAEGVAAALGWRMVNTDDLLHEDSRQLPSYLEYKYIDTEMIAAAFEDSCMCQDVVISGTCLRDKVADFMDRGGALVVYVATASQRPLGSIMWHDGIWIEHPQINLPWLTSAEIEYHRRAAPHRDADLTVVRLA
jgi:hypothetical protein